MEFLAADRDGERTRIRWLIRLRWAAVGGVLGASLTAGPILDMVPSPTPLYLLVGGLATWNFRLALKESRGRPVLPAGHQVVFDLLVLGALLFFSGGLHNPFAMFLAVQVILGAILLPRATALRIGLVGIGIGLTLALLEYVDLLPMVAWTRMGELPVWSLGLALVLTMAVALQLVIMVMDDLRLRARQARRYNEQAERERRKLFDVMRFVGAAMVLLDQELKIQWQNRRSEDVLGKLEVGQRFKLPDDDQWPAAHDLEAQTAVEREWTGPDVHGHPRVHHVTASPVRRDDGSLDQFILVFTDITDRRAAERQLQRTEKLAAVGRLAAGVAHEINTPLGSVSILTGEAIARTRELSGSEARAELEEHLDDIKRETERVAHIVRQLLELSHPGEEYAVRADLNEVIRDAVRLISVRLPRATDRIHMSLSDDLPLIDTNPDRIRQVILNLLDNALDATEREANAVKVRSYTTGESAVVQVQDSGMGIADDDIQRVFDPFFTTKDVGEGTGLGLYVSYEIMKNLGGDILIQSRLGAGTTVTLSLPLATGAAPKLGP